MTNAITLGGQPVESVNALIERVMAKYKGIGPAAEARYFKAVHQEIAPLARDLESENERLRRQLEAVQKA